MHFVPHLRVRVDFETYRSCDATELARRVREGETDARALLEVASARLEAVNGALNAVVADLSEAARTRLQREAPDPAGAFRGVPLVVKDHLLDVAGAPGSSGSNAYARRTHGHDSALVTRLRQAGSTILGKTNMPEFGFVPYTEPAAHGPTRNPWDLERTPGGSSGGSAAAVAAGIVPVASAADGGGSIRIPASCCGLFGLKPTRGLVSYAPHPNNQWHFAVSEGCVSRSVRDTAAYLDAVVGYEPGDDFAFAKPAGTYAAALAAAPPRRLRIALTTESPVPGHRLDGACVEAAQDAAQLCRELGHEVEAVGVPYRGEDLSGAFSTVVFAFAALAVRQVAADLRRRPERHELELPTRLAAAVGEHLSAADLAEAQTRWSSLSRELAAFHRDYDLVLTPTLGQRPFVIGDLQPSPAERRQAEFLLRVRAVGLAHGSVRELAANIFRWMPFTAFANMTGQPSMNVPLYWEPEHGLPVGVMFTGRPLEDATMLRFARQLEEARPWFARVPLLPGDAPLGR